jgi:hypothetical protein
MDNYFDGEKLLRRDAGLPSVTGGDDWRMRNYQTFFR